MFGFKMRFGDPNKSGQLRHVSIHISLPCLSKVTHQLTARIHIPLLPTSLPRSFHYCPLCRGHIKCNRAKRQGEKERDLKKRVRETESKREEGR